MRRPCDTCCVTANRSIPSWASCAPATRATVASPRTQTPLPKEKLAYRSDVDRVTFERDLETLGFERRRRIPIRDFDLRIQQRLRSARAAKALDADPRLSLPAARDLAASLAEAPDDPLLARAREAAWGFAGSAEDEFLFGAANFTTGRGPFVHQLETAKRVVEEMDGNAVVADEVGLGKTITAGLILLELQARGLADSTLIIVPSNLRQQWYDELLAFFDFENAEPTRLDDQGSTSCATRATCCSTCTAPRPPTSAASCCGGNGIW